MPQAGMTQRNTSTLLARKAGAPGDGLEQTASLMTAAFLSRREGATFMDTSLEQPPMRDRVKVGLVGSQFISSIHAESLHRVADAELCAVASPTQGNAARFAERFHIPHHFTDYRKMLE